AVRATVDFAETGEINPNVRARAAFNPDSEWIPVTRANGVLTAATAPSGGLICGLASVMNLDGWTWEQMTLRGDGAMYVDWPVLVETQTWALDDAPAFPKDRTRARVIDQMTTVFADARAYAKLKAARAAQGAAPPDFDARWEAMIPLLERKISM